MSAGTINSKVWRRVHGPEPYKSIGFGDIHGPEPYKFIGLGDIHGPEPYKFIGFGDRARRHRKGT